MTMTPHLSQGRVASMCSLGLLLQYAQGCAWSSDLKAAQDQLAAQAATLDQLNVELQSLRQERDKLTATNRELEASQRQLRDDYHGCLPKAERSGSTDSTGRFTALYRGVGGHHEWLLYDGVAFFHKYGCTVGDCSTGFVYGEPSAEEREAVSREWKRIAAGKR